MERLTVRGRKGQAYFDEDGLLIRDANGTFHLKKDMTAHFIHQRFVALDKVIDRLAAYEDTGLTPEEVTVLYEMDKRSRMVKMLHWEEAEKDGRLVVLPCSMENPVYVIAKCEDVCIYQERDTGAAICPFENDCQFDCCEEEQEKIFETAITGFIKDEERDGALHLFLGDIKFDFIEKDIGKTVFLTREDAEAALAAREGVTHEVNPV